MKAIQQKNHLEWMWHNDVLSSLKKSSEDYFEAHHAIIYKCDSEQAAKEHVLDQQEFTIDEAMSQLRVFRQMREAHSMIADLTIEVETRRAD